MKNCIGKKSYLDRLSPFSVVLTMVILMIIGLSLAPLLDVTSKPKARQGKTLSISYYWQGASPRVIEQEVTSKIEGIMSSVKGVKEVSSVSHLGRGQVNVELKENVNVSAVRFEVSSLIKQIYGKFPKGVSYPSLSGGGIGSGVSGKPVTKNLLTYRINADMDGEQIKEYIEQNVKPLLTQLENVTGVNVTGGTSKYMEITYDPLVLLNYGLNASTIADGIKNFIGKNNIVGDVDMEDVEEGRRRITLYLSTTKFSRQIGEIPLTTVGEKMIYLNDLTTYEYKERLPNSYFRVNGLNTIYMNIWVDADANLIRLSETLRAKIDALKDNLREGVYLTLIKDEAVELQTELDKLIRRTLLTLLVLLVFVWGVSRSMRYLSIISITLIANLLLAVIVYYLLDIRLHTFSLAGIAVSFGIIIDSSIVMVDHYSYYHNRKAFLAILAALLTTIGSLVIVFFMPEYIQRDLYDFSRIIIINLTIALLVALFFVPAIIEQLNYAQKKQKIKIKRLRRSILWNRFYGKYIAFTQKRKWVYIVLLILAFGLPVYMLPVKWSTKYIPNQIQQKEQKWYETWYDATIGSDFYHTHLRKPLDKLLGGTMRLFSNSLDKYTYKKEDKDLKLTIRAQMPLGGTVHQLNEKVELLDKFLAQFDEIKRFETRVEGRGATIQVEFKDEVKKGKFPYYLENRVIGKVLDIGGAEWSTSGVSDWGFSNSMNLVRREYQIRLSGYNYNRLYKYAMEMSVRLKNNGRVSDVIIEDVGNEGAVEELYMDFNRRYIALYQMNLASAHRRLQELLTSVPLGRFSSELINTDLQLKSKQMERFDLWNLNNSYLWVDGHNIAYNYFGEISKRKAKNSIFKKNQEYTMNVAFNFKGNWELADRYVQGTIDHFNNNIFPIGYHCWNWTPNWYEDTGTQYWLILLIVVIIFFMCSILFESFRLPLVIISLIPVSFIGTFLTFYFLKVNFGTGGFASLVLLSGLVVNAGIYILNEYNYFINLYNGRSVCKSKIFVYTKAYNHKIIPVFLTILSTVLGLVPFLIDGKEDEFWFSFAVGTAGGLLFSIFALIFIMPIFMPLRKGIK